MDAYLLSEEALYIQRNLRPDMAKDSFCLKQPYLPLPHILLILHLQTHSEIQ